MKEINKKFSKILLVIGIYFLIAFLIKLFIDLSFNNSGLNLVSYIYLGVGLLFIIGFIVVRYFLRVEVKRYFMWIVIPVFLILILFPFKSTYLDGGTREYNSLIYKVIKWHRTNDNYEGGYKTGKETHLFPYNFFSIDYYDEVVPENLYVSVNDQKIRTSLNSYCYTFNVNKLSREACVDSDYKVSLKYSDKLNIKSNENIELSIKFRKVNNIKVYKYSNEKDWYKRPKLDKNVSVEYNKENNTLNVSGESGEYIISMLTYYDKNDVIYTFRINLEK